MEDPKQLTPENRKIFVFYLVLWFAGLAILYLTNRISELLIVSILVIVFFIYVARYGLVFTKTLDQRLVTELLVNLPCDEAFDQCVKSLTTIHGDIDSSDKERGSLVAIPVGVPVSERYSPESGIFHVSKERIFFILTRESKTITRIGILYSMTEGSTFKIQKKQEEMKKIREYLQQWEVKIPDNNDRS
jgi:hypothetical protein